MATVTVVARHKPVTAAHLTNPWLNPRQLLHELLQLSDLVKPFHLLRSPDVPSADEHARQLRRKILLSGEDPLQLGGERRVHGEISLVDSHGEGAEDRSDGSAVLEGGTNDAEAGEVHDDATLRAGDRDPYRIWFRIPP